MYIHICKCLGNRHQHESECSFIPKPCPNDVENCGTFRSSELDHHLQVCPYFECEHKDKGIKSIVMSSQYEYLVFVISTQF